MNKIVLPDFSFTKFPSDAEMLSSAYSVITNLEKWDFLRNYIVEPGNGFCLDRNPIVMEIMDEICEKHPVHSGSTMGITMRSMEYIAKHGLCNFRRTYLTNVGREGELSDDDDDNDNREDKGKEYELFSCPVCLFDYKNHKKAVTLRCQHLVCRLCILSMNKIKINSDLLNCPLCRDEICHAHIKKAVSSQYPRKDFPLDVNFDFMNDIVGTMIISAYQVINETDTWDKLQFYRLAKEREYKHPLPSELKMIVGKIVDKHPSHTDRTIAYTMKQLHYIAQHGYQKYKRVYVVPEPI